MVTKRERYRGALVGVLAGDALLAPYETWTADKVVDDLTRRGGLVPFEYDDPWLKGGRFPPGRPTDDSDQTAALAESLIMHEKLDEEDLFNRLRHIVFEKRSPLWDGRAVGAGKTTRNALRPATYAESQARSRDDAFPSNGSLMRSSPLALYFGSLGKIDAVAVRRMSQVTHWHPVAHDCCAAYIGALVALLDDEEGLWWAVAKAHAQSEDVHTILHTFAEYPRDPEVWPGRGAAELTLHVALWALITSRDFREGLTNVARIGGDTDTYGAVAGGLLGAYYGIEGIPKEWRDVLIGREKMEFLADKLYEIAHC